MRRTMSTRCCWRRRRRGGRKGVVPLRPVLLLQLLVLLAASVLRAAVAFRCLQPRLTSRTMSSSRGSSSSIDSRGLSLPPRGLKALRPLVAAAAATGELTQVEVRQATERDFAAIAESRNAVIFVPEGRPAAAGEKPSSSTGSGSRREGIRYGSASLPAAVNEEQRQILSRIPYLVTGQAVAFIVVGRPKDSGGGGGGKPRVVATVDVFVKAAEGPLPRRLFIKNMIVDPSYRRQGHARRLLRRVDGYAREVGVGEVHLEVLANNAGAIALYEGSGYAFTMASPTDLLARALGIGKVGMRKVLRLEDDDAASAAAAGGGGGGSADARRRTTPAA